MSWWSTTLIKIESAVISAPRKTKPCPQKVHREDVYSSSRTVGAVYEDCKGVNDCIERHSPPLRAGESCPIPIHSRLWPRLQQAHARITGRNPRLQTT